MLAELILTLQIKQSVLDACKNGELDDPIACSGPTLASVSVLPYFDNPAITVLECNAQGESVVPPFYGKAADIFAASAAIRADKSEQPNSEEFDPRYYDISNYWPKKISCPARSAKKIPIE